jgi:hypothetical protein
MKKTSVRVVIQKHKITTHSHNNKNSTLGWGIKKAQFNYKINKNEQTCSAARSFVGLAET